MDPWSEKILYAIEQLIPQAKTTEAHTPRTCALQREATTVRSPCIATMEEPLLAATRESTCVAMKTQHSQKLTN